MLNKKNTPFVFSDMGTFEEQGGGVKRKILAYGDALMQVEVHFEKGAVGAMHSHPHSQLTYVLSGEFEFTIGDDNLKKWLNTYKLNETSSPQDVMNYFLKNYSIKADDIIQDEDFDLLLDCGLLSKAQYEIGRRKFVRYIWKK